MSWLPGINHADFLQTGHRIRIIADDIAHANIVGDALGGGIGKNRLKGFEIGMNVTEKGNPHRENTLGRRIPIVNTW